MKKITALKVLDNYRVWLRFSDGVEGEVDFSSKPRTGVYAGWASYDFSVRLASAAAANWSGTTSSISVPIRSGCK